MGGKIKEKWAQNIYVLASTIFLASYYVQRSCACSHILKGRSIVTKIGVGVEVDKIFEKIRTFLLRVAEV